MNARDWHKVWKTGTAAMSISACICAPCAAVAASGGTIQFTGMIVAPPFSIATAFAAPSGTTVTAGVGQSGPATTTITFAAAPNSPPNAEIALATIPPASAGNGLKTASPVVARFSDGDGHRLTPDQYGYYHLGASGGTLVLKAPDSATRTFAVVVTSYD